MKALFSIALIFSIIMSAQSQFLESKEDLVKQEGYFNFYYSEKDGAIYLEVERLNDEFLYVPSLATGLGSNDIGLDRGQLGNEAIVRFEKAGKKLLLVQPNMKYRAITDNDAERKSVEEAFARSVLYGFEIKEETEGKYIIDLTPFLMEDAHGVASRLQRGNHGSFKINNNKSALHLPRTKAFPENVEFEAMLTFEGEAASGTLRSVAPNAQNLTVNLHHSFVKLPDENYEKRSFSPGSGAISMSYYDYSTPVYEPLEKKFIIRHRLKKKDPGAEISEAVEPIIYYLDPGTPEPVRTALLEGAKWWGKAFEAIGYKDAYQVKMLPEDVDPLDVRYNVIQWVHRSTRGWSYGASVVDPRTGEIIKGHVSLGSLRIRQDLMIAQALLDKPFAERDDNYNEMMDLAIARIRQLSAHEVGHTLGFTHNFAASTNNNSSVMDYPHPMINLKDGNVDLTNAYDSGIGEWDKFTVKYSYSPVPAGSTEEEFLRTTLLEAQEKGLEFISDSDARATGGAHAGAHLWDNSKNPSLELERVLELRKQAIANFSIDNIRTGETYSVLEDVFVPLYFFHRYQTEAAVKRIGGLNYRYAVKGDNETVVEALDAEAQTQALRVVLRTLDAQELAIPRDKLKLFPPRAFGFSRSRESFKSNTGVAFDALGAAATASDMTLGLLLNPERAARLIQQKAIDQSLPGLPEVIDQLLAKSIQTTKEDMYLQEVQNSINYNVLQHLMNLAVHKDAIPQVKAITNYKLVELEDWFRKNRKKNPVIYRQFLEDISQFRKDPSEFKALPVAPQIPDGSPIGNF
ncbi:zinc-dependent metalloprotease [Antarcticibacterium flavum]|uniref:Zinc-dependent metalloprotease n=1 Tax=Antarcticibacterium flavum TaxID=2058175 RepID=A0A5B7WZ52_9FLAO|nr:MULTISPECIES: zinc-dependent metalloprotease [Antarcticibacterium]MCM4159005.1 peptidase [Antarcticibacterium sp. W02-3]QCY68255.1 zinc-dependent metalloprotease [Antarcticibacterium flavum]